MGSSETRANEAGAVAAGLVQDASNYVVASFERNGDPANGTVAIDVRIEGRKTRVASVNADLAGVTRCAFTVNENYVTALVAKGADWVPVVQHRITDLLDLRNPAVLRQYRYGFGAGGAGTTVTLADVRAGRDQRPSRHQSFRRQALYQERQALFYCDAGRPVIFPGCALGRVDARP